MYNHYFGLTSSPFAIAPDPNYLYMSPQHRDALAHLLYGIQSNGGFVMLTGDIGTGKTTLCRCMLNHTTEDTDVAFILNSTLNSEELLASICDELHIVYDKQNISIKSLSDAINHHLLKSHAAGRNTVLIIDEAQNLSPGVLEQMRLLTNLETNEKKLLQIVMFGQPELRKLVERPELKQLAQRITARFHLSPLKLPETQLYIGHRMAIAGYKQIAHSPPPIPKELHSQIHHLSGGVPRLINIICDRALLGAYARGEPSINSEILYQAAAEVFGEDRKPLRQPISFFKQMTAILGVIFIALIIYRFYPVANNWLTNSAEQSQASLTSSTKSQPSTPTKTEDSRKETAPVSRIVSASTAELAATPGVAIESPENNEKPPETTQLIPTQPELVRPTSSEPLLIAKKPSDTDSDNASQSPQVALSTNTPDSILETQTVIITSPEAVTAATVKPSMIQQEEQSPITNLDSETQAYSTLFKIWQQDMPQNTEPCKFALSRGLRCFHQQGNWAQLNRNNRPAIVRTLNSEGGLSSVALVRIEQGIAKFSNGIQHWQTPLEQLNDSSLLNYTLLWDPPAGYYQLTKPGSSGPHILWLKQQLARLSPLFISEMNNYFDDQLVLYIKAFQRSQNLLQDGVVGPETLIRLNTLIDAEVPMLLSSREP
ncbi:AAA family ATPase [Amphritea japonica]|uniref:General secretion pathway protein A n=1 Tax=Amphritea japonica ATCC BAA-1530 TaxID=1278309 RepID=A0A7R6PNT5_9GAMM|nr:AAA family ATPase [Amphritea japonica]BBB26743.1 general secretion pathway protein A [Amphritea japonica ATCC BAA-1530]